MRALACRGWLASNRTALNTSPKPPSTRFRKSRASGAVAGSSSRIAGIRAIFTSLSCADYTKPILNRSEEPTESSGGYPLKPYYREQGRGSKGTNPPALSAALQGSRQEDVTVDGQLGENSRGRSTGYPYFWLAAVELSGRRVVSPTNRA